MLSPFWFKASCLIDLSHLNKIGAIAKRLCRGLQSRLDQFDSGSRLQNPNMSAIYSSVLLIACIDNPVFCLVCS